MPVAKEQIRQMIADNHINSVADVYALLRDGFKDILQELMEAELDATLGYEKNQKGISIKDKGFCPGTLRNQNVRIATMKQARSITALLEKRNRLKW